MTNETIFLTQISSTLGFVVLLFVLYRLLVSQKEATIQLLNEKNGFLLERIKTLEQSSPDRLMEILSKRITVFEDEINRLSNDKDTNKKTISRLNAKLEAVQMEIDDLNRIIDKTKEISSELFCPYCDSVISGKEYYSESYEHGDIDHEFIRFECGLEIVDGNEVQRCRR